MGTVRLWINGRERDADVGREVGARAEALRDPELECCLRAEQPILAAGEASGPEACTEALLEALRARCAVDAAAYALPGGGRRPVALLRRLLWRLMRHPHEWFAFRHNTIHAQLVAQLVFEREERCREAEELRARVAQLERAAGARGERP
jgi:hypothetical protein